jgi:hypothetical protein
MPWLRAWLRVSLALPALGGGCCSSERQTQTFALGRDYLSDGGVGDGGQLTLEECMSVCISSFQPQKPEKLFGCHLNPVVDGGPPTVTCDGEYRVCGL